MEEQPATRSFTSSPGRYQIRLQGELDQRWAHWFDGIVETVGDGTTAVTAEFTDQAAIHGLLERVRDLGLTLIAVTRIVEPGPITSSIHE